MSLSEFHCTLCRGNVKIHNHIMQPILPIPRKCRGWCFHMPLHCSKNDILLFHFHVNEFIQAPSLCHSTWNHLEEIQPRLCLIVINETQMRYRKILHNRPIHAKADNFVEAPIICIIIIETVKETFLDLKRNDYMEMKKWWLCVCDTLYQKDSSLVWERLWMYSKKYK